MTDRAGGGRRPRRLRTERKRLPPSHELHTLMYHWRMNLDPLSVPGLVRPGRTPGPVRQAELAQLVGVSEMYYGALERGERNTRYSDSYLNAVAYALQLSPDKRNVLYLHAIGEPAPPLPRPPTTAITASMQWFINAQEYPAYYSDQAWDVISYNRAMGEWFPHLQYERNIMRWVYHYRQSQYQLVDWESVWAPLMMAQMWTARAMYPDNQRLAELIDEARDDCPLARHQWDHEPLVYEHPDGDRRWLHLPGRQDPLHVEIMVMTPRRADDLRCVQLLPVAVIEGREP